MSKYIRSICPNCNTIFNSWSKWGDKKFCSRKCANSRPMTDERRSKLKNTISAKLTIKNQFGEHKRRNKNKEEIAGPYTKIYLCTCKISGKQWYSTTVKTIHPSIQTTKNQYAYQCRFNFSISKYPEWFIDASALIKEYGWYSTPGSRSGIKNTNGISRDHLYSVSDGFKNNIDPKLLSHPANCQLIPHKLNQRKRAKSSITLDELLQKIKIFEMMYGALTQ